MFRIINPYLNDVTLRPIYLQHGLFGNSDHWILNARGLISSDGIYSEQNVSKILTNNCSSIDSVGRTLGFVLSACGYDVWLGNVRGNRYGSRHLFLDPNNDKNFWAYSVDQLSDYDLTANINYILNTTGQSSLGFIGHSLGSTMMFQLLSTRPQYSNIIRPFIALAPVVLLGSIESLILRIGAIFEPLLSLTPSPFLRFDRSINQAIAQYFCGNTWFTNYCNTFASLIFGFHLEAIDSTRVAATVTSFDSTSTIELGHLAQRVNRLNFDRFDSGSQDNRRIYGQSSPPQYNVSAITSQDIVLMSGVNDFLADPIDVSLLRSQLKVKFVDYVVPNKLWNHIDFIYGIQTGRYINAPILRILNSYN